MSSRSVSQQHREILHKATQHLLKVLTRLFPAKEEFWSDLCYSYAITAREIVKRQESYQNVDALRHERFRLRRERKFNYEGRINR
jgi:hypothetical protein